MPPGGPHDIGFPPEPRARDTRRARAGLWGLGGPEDVPGSYVLRRVAMDPLPAILYDNEIYAVRVLTDTIRLRADGTGTIVREAVPLHQGLPDKGPMTEWTPIHYRAVADEVEIDFDCSAAANCVPPPHLIARRTGNGLTVRWGPGTFGRLPLLYTQVKTAP